MIIWRPGSTNVTAGEECRHPIIRSLPDFKLRAPGGLGGYTGVRDRFDHPETGLTHVRTLGVRTTGGLEGCTGARDWGELSSYSQMSVGALQVCRTH